MSDDREKGLYRKYRVTRIGDETGKHDACEFFVLDWLHDKFAVDTMRAYAMFCQAEFPALADELRNRADYYEKKRPAGGTPGDGLGKGTR